MRWSVLFGPLLIAALGGCALLPSAAPTSLEFENSAAQTSGPGFILVDLDLAVAKAMTGYGRVGLTPLGSDSYRPSLVIKPGDVISITVYEVTPTPIFGATPGVDSGSHPQVGGHIATIPSEVVEQNGRVPIPFGGAVLVSGLTPEQAGRAIARALEGKATNPQAVVSLVSSVLNTATVNGDVGHPGLVPLTLRGERVLDVVAAAGGPRYPTYDTDVQLIRGGRVARVGMQQLIEDQKQNLRIRPGDSIILIHNPRSFAVLGSALKVSQFDFNVEHVTLAEAIARAGGLNDNISNVGDLYLLRFEPKEKVDSLLPLQDPQRRKLATEPAVVPVAYHLNLRGASGYFISQSVQMRDKDVVLVTNADSVQLSKFLAIVKDIAGIYYDFALPGGSSSAKTTATTVSADGTN